MNSSKHLRVATLGLASIAFAAAAHAQASHSAVVYGRVNTGLEYVDASRSAVDLQRTRLSNYRSVVGFRGDEDLGAGLKAVWQIEGGFAPDTGSGSIANRDTRIGLQGGFGTVFAGVWTLPYTAATSGFDPFYPTTAGYMALMGNGSAPSASHTSDTSAFDRRQQNQLQYWSPTGSPLSARLAWGANDGERGPDGAKPSLFSLSIGYDAGTALLLTAAHERHDEYQARGTADTASKLGAAWRFAAARIGAVYERLRYETATGSLERDSWYVSGSVAIGRGSLSLGHSRAGDGKGGALETIGSLHSGAHTGSSQTTLGYEHPLSRRTAVFAYWSRIDNESAGRYDFAINELGIAPGARPSVFALGMRHGF